MGVNICIHQNKFQTFPSSHPNHKNGSANEVVMMGFSRRSRPHYLFFSFDSPLKDITVK